MLQIQLLGEFNAKVGSEPLLLSLQAAKHVLLCLALSQHGRIDREQTAATLWPNSDSKSAKSNLRQAVFRLRRELQKRKFEHVLETSNDSIVLQLGSVQLDSNEVVDAIRTGRKVPSPEVVAGLDDSLLPGIELENEAMTDWVRFVRADFRTRLQSALTGLFRSQLTTNVRLEAAECLLEFDSTNEEACRFAMRQYYERGENAKALRCYSSLWAALSEEFDVEPSSQTQEIAVKIKVNESTFDNDAQRNIDIGSKAIHAIGATDRQPQTRKPISMADLSGTGPLKFYLYWYFPTDQAVDRGDTTVYVDSAQYTIEEIVGDCSGIQIKSFAIHEYFAEFDTCSQAINCALSVLRAQTDTLLMQQTRAVAKMAIIGHFEQGPVSLLTAQKLASLSNGHDLIVTASVREHITASVDAIVEDIGETYIDAYDEKIRCFRLTEIVGRSSFRLHDPIQRTIARLAIIPLEARIITTEHDRLIGDVFADELIHLVAANGHFEVISRQSTKAFSGGVRSKAMVADSLDCDYVFGGSFSIADNVLETFVELSDRRTESIILSERYIISDFQKPLERADKCADILNDLYVAIGRHAVKQLRAKSPVTLESHKLLTAAANMMNRFGNRDFFLARRALEVVVSRSPFWAPAHAMLAEWRVMRAQQGWMIDKKREAALASDAASRALDCDPDCSSAHVAEGVVQLHFFGRIDIARSRYDDAIDLDKNNCLAWFSRSALRSFTDEGDGAAQDALRAIELSPFDPASFLYQNAMASACLAKGESEEALKWVEKSLKLNKLHASSLRMRILANWRLGNEEKATIYAKEFMSVYPDFTVEKYKQYAPVDNSEVLTLNAKILGWAGIPL